MKTRTCPHCNYRYSLEEYLKKPFFKGVFSSWNCLNCGKQLTTEENRRWLLSFLAVVPAVGFPYLIGWISEQGLPYILSAVLAFALLALYEILIFSFDRFCLPGNNKSSG